MTTNDFFFLFVAFGGFLGAPALLLWGIVRLSRGKSGTTRGPGRPPDVGTPDRSSGPRPVERPHQSPDFSRRIAQLLSPVAPRASPIILAE
ncbi:MAG TPA: hypothetical protein VEC60_02880 [Reyranella sp.]|nr:hypothetical protein [Reyranella sp.]